MGAINNTITITGAEYRPCYVNGKKALFHRWIDIEQPTLRINGLCGVKYVNEVRTQFLAKNIIPHDVDVLKIKNTFAIVEYEDGTVANVEPQNVCFADDKIKEYAF